MEDHTLDILWAGVNEAQITSVLGCGLQCCPTAHASGTEDGEDSQAITCERLRAIKTVALSI